jgi:23S rRNA (uracil1939-C5)-methyltransferase
VKRELEIADISPGGDGVALTEIGGERRAVFVPGVALGELVSVEIDPKPRPARGRLLSVVRASPDRIAAPCAFSDRCGGCDWMHLTPSAQVAAHVAIVSKLLGVPVTAHAAPKTLGYRTRARLHVDAPPKKPLAVRMFARGSHTPAVVDTCVVLDPALDGLPLAKYLEGAKGRGDAAIALGAGRKPVFELRWHGQLPAETFGRVERAVNAGEIAGARIDSATIGDPTPVVKGADGEPLKLASGGFSQASEETNILLAERVAALATGDPCVELHAGAGNLTVLLAKTHPGLVAVESNRDACVAARANLAARGLTAKIVEADAAEWVLPKAARLVVLDPPREGAKAVCAALAKGSKLKRIVYVSCDPSTLARDIKILGEGAFRVASAETFEMFPHTSHVETVVVLDRA